MFIIVLNMEFTCSFCGTGFYQKRYLKSHINRLHKNVVPVKDNSVRESFNCEYCEKTFSTKNSRSKHIVRVHNVKKLTVICQEKGCDEKFRTIMNLRQHLEESHNIENIGAHEDLEFENSSAFFLWLSEEEKKTKARFVVTTKGKRQKDCLYSSYTCNRSGVYKPTVGEDRDRQLKCQGTMKLGFHCTSSIIVRDFNTCIKVAYFKQHYRHNSALCHIPIPYSDKTIIAGKLLQGVTEKKIMQDIKCTFTSELKRSHLLTRKDIYNIKRQFGIRNVTAIENDEEHKSKITKYSQNFKRHNEAKKSQFNVQEKGGNCWEIVSESEIYEVTKTHVCKETCAITCRSCIICTEAYNCSCHDYLVGNNICKHIHYIIIKLFNPQKFSGPLTAIKTIKNSTTANTIKSVNYHQSNKEKLLSIYSRLSATTEINEPTAKQIHTHLNAIEHLLNVPINEKINSVQKRIREPTNKNIIKQKRFFSTKKTRVSKKVKYSNPSAAEINDIKANFLNPEFFVSTDSKNDHLY